MAQKRKGAAIPVIDLFAGPGGLGEGFSGWSRKDKGHSFEVVLSIEKDVTAHKTLELRAFFREFPNGQAPKAYYQYLRGEIARDELLKQFPKEAKIAQRKAWCAELGHRKYPDQIVDRRITSALRNRQRWVLIGGPPCQAYSLVGRSRMKGKNPKEFEKDRRHILYREYLRILKVHRPPVFIMENVKGLLSSKLNGRNAFEKIVTDLERPLIPKKQRQAKSIGGEDLRYRVYSVVKKTGVEGGKVNAEDFVVRSEGYGVPQSRHRVILIGVRNDISLTPRLLSRQEKMIPIQKVLSDLPMLRSTLSGSEGKDDSWESALRSVEKARWLNDPQVAPKLRSALGEIISHVNGHLTRGSEFIRTSGKRIKYKRRWYHDPNLGGVCNHSARGHMKSDLERYLFASAFAKTFKRIPLLSNFPKALLPRHANVKNALDGSNFSDRFRVQVVGRPSTTITSHISKDGHYYIHYDPHQCRSLTVREAARLQTFPDNYYFEGPRTEQYKQVGNAVPPLLAKQIASIVRYLL